MLKDILNEKGLSVYKVAKETEIPYSTLHDIVVGNTLIENMSSNALFRLAKYLELSMEQVYTANNPSSVVYLYNEGRNIFVEFGKHKMQYMGPKNLMAFKRVNRVPNRMVCVDTYFYDEDGSVYVEEDYVDLEDVFGDYGLINELPLNIEVKLGKPGRSIREQMIDEALFVSDSMVVTYEENSAGTDTVLIVNLNRTNQRMLLALPDYEVLHTNMSVKMQEKAINAVKRNSSFLAEKIKEVHGNA